MVVSRSSEYHQAYKAKYSMYYPIYASNFNFRKIKRKTEDSHDTNPFNWRPEDEELESNLTCRSTKPSNIPAHMYKHLLFNKAYKQKTDCSTHSEPSEKVSHKLDEEFQSKLKLNLSENSEQTSTKKDEILAANNETTEKSEEKKLEQTLASGQLRSTTMKIRKPQKPFQKKIPRSRPLSSGSSKQLRKASSVRSKPDKPPFEAYGSLDRERETAVKKTHNIRASSEVYPAALRAHKRRQMNSEERKKQVKSAQLRLKRNYFDELITKETQAWETEYRHHFVGFDEKIYKANLSARAVVRASSL